jgi:hypothetical protein
MSTEGNSIREELQAFRKELMEADVRASKWCDSLEMRIAHIERKLGMEVGEAFRPKAK